MNHRALNGLKAHLAKLNEVFQALWKTHAFVAFLWRSDVSVAGACESQGEDDLNQPSSGVGPYNTAL